MIRSQSYAYQYYPIGYRTPLIDSVRTEIHPNDEINQLYDEFLLKRSIVNDIDFVLKLVDLSKKLFGDIGLWFDAQDNNTKLSKNGYGLLEDTIDFVNTGHRTINFYTRIGLIESEHRSGDTENLSADTRKSRLQVRLKSSPNLFIYDWIKRRGGVCDLLLTVKFIFGTNFIN